jgi:NTP pyrophosphatase (non-canonical NTP hydrolase)
MKFIKDNPKVLDRAIKHFGTSAQLDKLEEELGELKRSIQKFKECGFVAKSHLAEELVDVSIVSAQIVKALNLQYLMSEWGEAKIVRLEKMLNEEIGGGVDESL